MSKRVAIYFRDGMKAVFDADKVSFVNNGVNPDSLCFLLSKGKRIVRWESVNWVKEVEDNDLE